MRSGCPWRVLPSDLPPWSTIYRWFVTFRDEGRFEKINHALVMRNRERIGRQSSPTGAIASAMRSSIPTWPRARTTPSEHSGPRWRRTTAAGLTPHLPVQPAGICRQRICGREGCQGDLDRGRDRAEKSEPGWLRGQSTALGRRALLCMDRAQSQTGKGLRGNDRLRTSLPLCRFRHAAPASAAPARSATDIDVAALPT